MAKNDSEDLDDIVLKAMVDSVKGAAKRVLEYVRPKYQKIKRQRDSYTKKAQVVDIASRYLRDGVTEVDPDDRKAVGATYAQKLQEVVNFNKKYQAAKAKTGDVSGLKRKISSLERAKSKLENDLAKEKSKYERKLAKLEKENEEYAFVLERVEALQGMSERQYKAVLGDEQEKKDARKALIESTHYDGEPTIATTILQRSLNLRQARDAIYAVLNQFDKDVKDIFKDEPENSGK